MKGTAEQLEHEYFFHQDTNISTVGRRRMRTHSHTHFEIYYITKGSCCYFVEDKVYHLVPGDVVLVPAGVPHCTEYQNTVYTRMLISCSEFYIPEPMRASVTSGGHLYRSASAVSEIDGIFQKVKAETENGDEYSEEVLRCYTHLLFYVMERHHNEAHSPEESKHYIDEALEYLQTNFSLDVTLSDIAGRCFVSPEHFSRTFKERTGFHFSEYLNLLRLRKAELLLRQLNIAPMTEIAATCGFNDSNYFSVKFKEMYGVSPKKYQTAHKKK